MGRLKHEALREEVHCFDDPNLSEAAPTASAQITVQPCTCCNAICVFPLSTRRSFLRAGLEAENEFDHLGGGHLHGFGIDPGPAVRSTASWRAQRRAWESRSPKASSTSGSWPPSGIQKLKLQLA